jgi:hypothetical protein
MSDSSSFSCTEDDTDSGDDTESDSDNT